MQAIINYEDSSNEVALITDYKRAEGMAEILKAIAHPLRLMIVARLCQGRCHVNALAEFLEEKQSIVSQQLKILRVRGLVAAEKEDGKSYYHLAEPRLIELMTCMQGCSTNR